MKKIVLSFVILAIAVTAGYAQTNVSGGIYANTTWTLANSPYIVTDTVVVFPGVTLTIEPGVVVKFDSLAEMEIRQGNLIAQGTNTDSITFTKNTGSNWSGIYLNQVASINFNYCNFSYSVVAINDYALTDTIKVKNSNFKYNWYCIYSQLANPYTLVDSCNFNNNNCGIVDISNGVFRYCDFVNNERGLNTQISYGLIIIANCECENDTIGLYSEGNLIVINSFFDNNSIALASGGIIDNCTVSNNKRGLVESGNAIEIKNCIIDSNTISGIEGGIVRNCEIKYNGTGIWSGGGDSIMYNIIDSNNIGISLAGSSSIYCNKICNNSSYGLSYTGSANISLPNNYWCTPDSASTEAVIYDGYDNVNYGLVSFMPLDTQNCYLTFGINECMNSSKINIQLYPNPTTDNITIETPSLSTIEISNIQGQLIKTLATSGTKTNIDVSALPCGVYVVQVKTEKGVAVKKFIKE